METENLGKKLKKESDIINLFNCCRGKKPVNMIMGIGDDCAVISPRNDSKMLMTVDQLTEKIHFIRDDRTARLLGKKIVSTSVSDILSMGGKPEYFLIAVSVPNSDYDVFVRSFAEGVIQASELYCVTLIGGDTCSSAGYFSASVSMTGYAESGKCLYRSGAQPGDVIFVSGFPGLSALGLELILRGEDPLSEKYSSALKAHLDPVPPFSLAGKSFFGNLNASTDISDGLVKDIYNICEASSVNAVIDKNFLPQHNLFDMCGTKPSEDYILYGGEDYQLVFTVSSDKAESVTSSATDCGIKLTDIGKIEEGTGQVYLKSSDTFVLLENRGFDHLECNPGGKTN